MSKLSHLSDFIDVEVFYLGLFFIEKTCTAPGHVDNAIERGEYTYGSTVVHTCVRGYYRSAGEGHIICNNGVWHGTMPTCSSEYLYGKLKCYNTHIYIYSLTKYKYL